MADLDTLNRRLNRCGRELDELARLLSQSDLDPVEANVRSVAEALEIVKQLQRQLYERRPDLEYHYDDQREPTQYMLDIQTCWTRATDAEQAGDLDTAARCIRDALAMEPPAIVDEMLRRQLTEILEGDAGQALE